MNLGKLAARTRLVSTLIVLCGAGCSSSDSSTDAGTNNNGSLALNPGVQGFGAVAVGQVSPPVTFTLENTGAVTTPALTASTTDGDPASPFHITNDGCTGVPLVPGARCTMLIAFAPKVAGLAQDTLTLTGGDHYTLFAATLSGIGGAAGTSVLTAYPNVLAFGAVQVGAPPAAQSVTVVNAGTSTLGSVSTILSGAQAADFAFVTDQCSGTTLTSGTSCYVSVSFAPLKASTSSSASLTIASGTTTAVVALTGSSDAPATLTLNATTHDFGACPLGSSCGPQGPFTLTNTGQSQSGNVDPLITGPDAADFALYQDGCTLTFLQPGVSCTFTMVFTPSRLGTETATLRPGGVASPPTAPLTGSGVAIDAGTITDAGSSDASNGPDATADAGP